MTEIPTSQPTPPPEQLHWGISYLREDIQDLRQEMRDNTQELRQEIQGVRQELREETRLLHGRMDTLGISLNSRLDETNRHLDARFSSLIMAMAAIGGLIVSLIGVVIVMVRG